MQELAIPPAQLASKLHANCATKPFYLPYTLQASRRQDFTHQQRHHEIQFEMMGTYCVNESVAISRARDKLRSTQLLSRKGVGIPVTAFARSPDDVKGLIREVGGAPLVIKLLEGTQGIGVVLAEANKGAESVIQAFMGLRSNILIQEFIKEAKRIDVRCFVVGDKVIAAMQRTAPLGEFRSNLHRGGSAQLVTLTPKERAMAIKAAQIIGLNVCGVDLFRSAKTPKRKAKFNRRFI